MKRQLDFISIVSLILLLGCSADKQSSSETLSLALSESNGRLEVVDYQVRNNTFVKSQQQGRYQVHIINSDNSVLRKINFDRTEFSVGDKGNPEIDFYVSVPLLSKADRIKMYMLDGSSGHYQLKTDNPLLIWQIPESILPKNQTVRE
ncbi:MAG: hypothetical protein GWN00_03515 [Aliifodinibius sp.]|nr:hypothetical protein [Fodinibius sp.]NIV10276.1 hypothetical protein [Fodinibius sp.]NIY23906.1 hypothetical protein [Fodinibius sp.]